MADLETNKNATAPANLRFAGPYLVRSEANYQVVALPGVTYVHWGDRASIDQNQLRLFRAEVMERNELDTAPTTTSGIYIGEIERVSAALESDGYHWVREVAGSLRGVKEDLRKKRLTELTANLEPSADGQARRDVVEELSAPPPPIDLQVTVGKRVFLSDAKWTAAEVGWGNVARNHCTLFWPDPDWQEGVFLRVGGRVFSKGLYAHSSSRYEFALDGKWKTFTAEVGLQDGADATGSAVFIVRGDGTELARSAIMRVGKSESFTVNVAGVQKLELLAEGGEGHNENSWAVWLQPELHR
jgi:hypothetical protein